MVALPRPWARVVECEDGGLSRRPSSNQVVRDFIMNLNELSMNDRLAIASLMHSLKTGMKQNEFDKLPEDEKLKILDERESGYLFICGRNDIEES